MKLYETMTDEALGVCLRNMLASGVSEINCADLIKEVKPKKRAPRVATINTTKALRESENDFLNFCDHNDDCSVCEYRAAVTRENCFANWLAKEIEVAE